MAVYLTLDHCKTWEKIGKIEFSKTCKSSISTISNTTSQDLCSSKLLRAVYGICRFCVQGNLKVEQVEKALDEIMGLHTSIPSLVADVLSILDVETLSQEKKGEREKFSALTLACSHFFNEALLKERLDLDSLEMLGLITSRQQFNQKYVKVKTRLYYKQQKFNLLREESEGYAKLVSELNQDVDELSANVVLETIKALIGCFDLDPNRVLDVILEAFEARPFCHAFFIPLIKLYVINQDTLCHILGFKYHFYQQTQDSETPYSLHKITALLLQHNLIHIDNIYCLLNPSDNDILSNHKQQLLDAKQYAKKVGVVSLSTSGTTNGSTDKAEKDDKLNKLLIHNNQKLGLCEALLDIGDWENTRSIINRLPPNYTVAHRPVALALCKLLSSIIEPLYKSICNLPKVLQKRTELKSSITVAGFSPQVSVVHNFASLDTHVFTMIKHLGPYLSCDPVLLVKLVRIGKIFLRKREENPSLMASTENVFFGFLTVLDETILPSLSLLPCNCCLAEEIWNFIKLLKYEHRYRLYGQWKNNAYNSHIQLIMIKADSIERAKYIMKRLAKENVKPLGRQIGKLSHSNPGVFFEHILTQIQRYDNLIGPVVDSLKFLTSLSYDMLAYCIMESLATPNRDKLKDDDTNTSLWLQSLANFSGAIFKKYPIELSGTIQYVINQLKAGSSYDLLILREIITKMAGIEISEEVTDDQLQAMSGGELLKQEGGYFAQVRNTKKSSARLKESLMENDMAISLCLLLAQQRNEIVFVKENEENRHLKLIGKLYDQCQDTFVQYTSFLSIQLSIDELTQKLPSITDLMEVYHISPDACFSLCRILYTNSINAKFEAFRKQDKKEKKDTSSGSQIQNKMQRYGEAIREVLGPITQQVAPLHSPRLWDDLTLNFYTTFWYMTLNDLQVPSTIYEKHIQQLRQQITTTEDNKEMAQNKKKKEKERCSGLVEKLTEEEKRQQEHVKLVMAFLKQEKDSWFVSRTTKNAAVMAFLQQCVFPRCCFTAVDALYCAKFIHILHSLKTAHFSSLICYDRILCDVTFSVSSCTENEAHRYGRFLCAVLATLMRWHGDKSIYEKECASFPGFVTVFKGSNNKPEHLDYENFRHVCHKWHFSITRAMISCLQSSNYVQIRNGLIVLTKVLSEYPRLTKFGQAIEKRVERISQEEREKRPDIYTLAVGYHGQLKLRKKLWITEAEFHQKETVSNSTSSTSSTVNSTSAQTATSSNENHEESAKTKTSKESENSTSKASVNGDIKDQSQVSTQRTTSKREDLRNAENKDFREKELRDAKEKKKDKVENKERPRISRKDQKEKDRHSKEEQRAPVQSEKSSATKSTDKPRVSEKMVRPSSEKSKSSGYQDDFPTQREELKVREERFRERERIEAAAREAKEELYREQKRRSHDTSQKLLDDSDNKRRKMDSSSNTSKDGSSRDSAYPSDSNKERTYKNSATEHRGVIDRSVTDRDRVTSGQERLTADRISNERVEDKREKKERKRVSGIKDRADEQEHSETKRYKSDEYKLTKQSQNGESESYQDANTGGSSGHSRDRERTRSYDPNTEYEKTNKKSIIKRLSASPDVKERKERISSRKIKEKK